MNQTQMKYAKLRLENLLAEKKKYLKDKYTTKGKKLSSDQKLDALVRGDFVIREKTDKYYWYQNISFGETEDIFDNDAYRIAETKLFVEYRKVMDELILGDNEEALRLIKAFEVLE